MQLFVIALVLGIFLADRYSGPVASVSGWQLALIVFAPKLLLLAIYSIHARLVLKRMAKGGGLGAMRLLQSTGIAYRWLLLASFGQDLAFGLLPRIRSLMGSDPGGSGPILIDELIAMAPPLLTLIGLWWSFYPIDRRMREAAVMRDLDAGKPIYRIWSRREYLISQIRHGILFLLVPLILIMAITEIAQTDLIAGWGESIELPNGIDLPSVLILAGTIGVFIAAPLVIRLVWDTRPMPPGELRDMLIDMCRRHRIGVRELLIWHTYGAMMNAAVIGIFAPLRYILMTDALLETMSRPHVEAVMAHEIAHVRRHHMGWMLLIAAALLIGFQSGWLLFADALYATGDTVVTGAAVASASAGGGPAAPTASIGEGPETVAAIMAVICWLIAFGWVSRRFERQADTFAVQHLTEVFAERQSNASSRETNESQYDQQDHGDTSSAESNAPLVVDPRAVATMSNALGEVAALHLQPRKRSGWRARLFDWLPDSSVWRHGSIQWRQQYLQSLVGQSVDHLAIDRQIRWIKRGGAVMLVLIVVLEIAVQ